MFNRIFNFFRIDPVANMDQLDRDVIIRFADGDVSLRKKAISIHRQYIPILGVRGTSEQDFMAEIDHPVPDLRIREIYRTKLLEDDNV